MDKAPKRSERPPRRIPLSREERTALETLRLLVAPGILGTPKRDRRNEDPG